jgi:hypothetical protein
MANEHVLWIETHPPISFTVSDSTGIEQGTLMTLSDPMTVAASAAKEAVTAGVLASEKIASDGILKASVYTRGYFKATASGSITAGDALISTNATAPNKLETAGVNAEDIVGRSMEDATDGQTFIYELLPYTSNLA